MSTAIWGYELNANTSMLTHNDNANMLMFTRYTMFNMLSIFDANVC